MIRRFRSHSGGHARGQALVETAIALPLLLLLGLTTFDVGRGIFSHIALTQATQEGALYAAYNPAPGADIIGRVRTSSNNEAVVNAVVPSPICTASTAAGAGSVVVRSSYELPVMSPPARFIFGPTFTLSVEITATNFKGDCTP